MNEETNVIQLEQESLAVRSDMAAIEVVDQGSYDLAVQMRTKADAWLKKTRAIFRGMKDPAYAAWKKICQTENEVCDPADNAIKQINQAIIRFDNEQRQRQREAQQLLEADARRIAQEEQDAQAKHLEQSGADEATVEAVKTAPIVITTPVVAQPSYEKSSSVIMRDNWQGECFDLHALIKAVAKDKSKIGLLQINQSALNSMAKALKETMSDAVPGCRSVNKKVVATGRG